MCTTLRAGQSGANIICIILRSIFRFIRISMLHYYSQITFSRLFLGTTARVASAGKSIHTTPYQDNLSANQRQSSGMPAPAQEAKAHSTIIIIPAKPAALFLLCCEARCGLDAGRSPSVQQQGEASLAAIGEPPIRANNPPPAGRVILISGLYCMLRVGSRHHQLCNSIFRYDFSKNIYTSTSRYRPQKVPSHTSTRPHQVGRSRLLHGDNIVPCITARERSRKIYFEA